MLVGELKARPCCVLPMLHDIAASRAPPHLAAQSLCDMEAMLRPLAAHRKVPRDTYALQVGSSKC